MQERELEIMRVIVAGSRSCKDYEIVKKAIEQGLEELGITPTVIVSGGAYGVDKLGEKYAKENGINIKTYQPNWKDIKGKDPKHIGENKYGKYYKLAGFERNQKMAENADALIAINLGTSGTEDMVKRAKEAGLKIYLYGPSEDEHFGFNFWE